MAGPTPGHQAATGYPRSRMSTKSQVSTTNGPFELARALVARPNRLRALATIAGYGFLVWTLVIVLFLPNGWLPIWTSAAATALLAADRRLGPLPAAMLVMLAVPVGRGAEVGLPTLPGTDVPVRMHDAIGLVGVLIALPRVVAALRRPRLIQPTALLPLLVFGVVGAVALAIGLAGDNAMRDIVRDTRWWAFYAVGVLAVIAGTPRAAVIRALVWGLALYALVILMGMLMPVFYRGLKWYAYSYDPRMRLHYGQATFVLLAAAYVARRVTVRPDWPVLALLVLLAAAIGVTLTRTLLVGIVGVTAITAVATAILILRRRRSSPRQLLARVALRASPALLAVVVGVAAGFGTYSAGVQIWQPLGAAPSTGRGSAPDQPPEHRPVIPSLDRVFEGTPTTSIAAQIGGRLASYASAFSATAQAPLLGHGMGTLAEVPWAWGGFRAHTPGSQPGVDNAYLTVGLKAGVVGIAAFGAMLLWPLRMAWTRRRLATWFIPAWLAVLGLTLIQSFAVSGYAPFTLSILLVLPVLGSRAVQRTGAG